ncbi:MAG TPA: hypothetical protein VH855_11920 [Acetobacteraceae bacterium]
MRALCLGMATVLVAPHLALAESKWLESGRLEEAEIRVLCERVGDVRMLARMQMISSGGDDWLRLSRQELVIESTIMGVFPLDSSRCYVIARAGPADGGRRRAFEVRDFAVSTEQTSVFVVGRAHDLPPDAVQARP